MPKFLELTKLTVFFRGSQRTNGFSSRHSVEGVARHLVKRLVCSHGAFQRVLHRYSVDACTVYIGVTKEGELLYCIEEPKISNEDLEVLKLLLDAILAEGVENHLHPTELKKVCSKYGIDYSRISKKYLAFHYYISKGLTGYGPLYPLILDDEVEELAVDGPSKPVSIFHRRVPIGWMTTNITLDEDELDSLVLLLSRRCGKSISIAHPYVEGLLPEGHRLAATFSKEVSRHGSSIVIRKHIRRPLTLVDLIKSGTISTTVAAYLWLMVEHRAPMLIVGPTAAGKTTLLQALALMIPSTYRIVTIEDTPELNLEHHPRWDSLITRHTYVLSEGEDVDLYKLAKFSLRRRADYIIIGEVRGEEAKLLVHAAASGHGVLATFHAENALTALMRLKSPPIGIGDSFIPLLWAVITIKRIYNQRLGQFVRRVTEVSEIVPSGEGGWKLVTVVRYDSSKDSLEPATIEELLNRSYRLKMLAEVLGIELDEVAESLKIKAVLLDQLVANNADFRDVVSKVNSIARAAILRSLKILEGEKKHEEALKDR